MQRFPTAILAVAAVLAAFHSEVAAAAVGTGQRWMPDVAGRIEELGQRTRQAAAEASERETRELDGGQWWRLVAVSPPSRDGFQEQRSSASDQAAPEQVP